ncbi:hypothetical protein QTP88_018863 [Uroleucon formosanum]
MTDDLPALTIRRGTLKGRITKFIKFLQDFAIDGDVSQIRVRKQKIEECWDEFQNIQSAIEVKVTNEAAAAVEENYRFEFEDLYFQAIADSEKMLNKTGHNINQNISNSELPGSTASSHQASIVKLAALNVPQFSGNYKEWSTFNDMFTALIHSNEALTEVQKFFYLKAALSGDAAEVVKCFETSAKNYKIAWDCLNERFNNKRIMVQAHTKAIFDLESITEESSGKLRQFVDKLFSHIKALEAIGYNPISWGPMLLHIISIKLDHATLRAWETQAPKTEVPKVEELIAFLKGRFQILESIENAQGLHKFGNGLSQMPITDNKLKGNIKPKTKSLFAHTTVVKFKCYVCEEPHAIYKCKQFLDLTVKERRENVIKLKLCTNCLSKHKENSKCKSKGCRKCGELHNTLLHENVAEQNEPNTNSNPAVANKGIKRKGKKDVIGEQIVNMVRGIYNNRSARDEFVVLGEEVANSVRNLNTDYARKTIKFKIQTMLYEASLGHYDFPPNMQNCQNYSLHSYNMGTTERINDIAPLTSTSTSASTSISTSTTTIIPDSKETNSDMNRPSDILSQSLVFMNDF